MTMNDRADAAPTFLGIGGQKCASTWLSECLRAHPEIFVSSPKEIHFFERPDNRAKGRDWYLEHFAGSEGNKAAGEFTPNYLTEAPSIEEVHETLGDIKLIALLREPTERFFSHYKHAIRKGLLPSGRQTLTLPALRAAIETSPDLLRNGLYAKPLKAWMEVFGRDSVHVIIKDDIDAEPATVLADVFSFLDVDPTFTPPMLKKQVSPGIVPRFHLFEAMRQKVYRAASFHLPGAIDLVKRTRISELYRRMNALPKGEDLAIEADVEGYLADRYAEDVADLERLLGRSLPWRTAPGLSGGETADMIGDDQRRHA